jgi:hypothetical protein
MEDENKKKKKERKKKSGQSTGTMASVRFPAGTATFLFSTGQTRLWGLLNFGERY